MQLPDESISYQFDSLLVPQETDWTTGAELRAQHLLSPTRLKDLVQPLMQAKSQVAAEREMRNVVSEEGAIEAGFIDLPQAYLDGYRRQAEASPLGQIIAMASRISELADRVIFLGMGGELLPPQIYFQTLKSRYHNEIPAENRLGTPRVYFEGDHPDNDSLQELLDLNQYLSIDPDQREERWAVVICSKSDLAVETAATLRALYRDANDYYGLHSEWIKHLFVPVAGSTGSLREMFVNAGYLESEMLSIPDNVGSRYCAFTAAGLLPAAIMGLDIRAILQGAAAMTRRFLEEPFERNLVLQHAGINYLMMTEKRKTIRALVLWSQKMEALGRWYVSLIGESLSRHGTGPFPVAMTGSRDVPGRANQLQEGKRDRLLTNLIIRAPRQVQIDIQMSDNNADGLNTFARKGLPDIMSSTSTGLAQAQWEVARPTADILVPTLNEHTLGQLLQMLMLSTVVEGRLLGINPYTRPGKPLYERNMWEEMKKSDEPM